MKNQNLPEKLTGLIKEAFSKAKNMSDVENMLKSMTGGGHQ